MRTMYDEIQDEIRELDAKVERLEAENARLRDVVDKLPKTADGVPVIPGTTEIFWRGYRSLVELLPLYVDEDGDVHPMRGFSTLTHDTEQRRVKVLDCYSTREAAEAAAKGGAK